MNAAAQPPVIRIEPTRGWAALRLGELWEHRDLLYFFAWRDVKVRYKQSLLGVAWAVLQPFFTMVIFSLFFGRLARVPSDGVPYPIFAFTALVPWMFFATGINQSSNSLVNNASLIKKVYFPRLAVPVACVLASLVDFVPAFVVLLGMMAFYGFHPGAQALWMPAFLLLAFVTALGVGIWLAALNVYFRDVRYIVPFLIQCWLFATPIAYPSSLLAERWKIVYALNPMVGVVDGFRWALLGIGAAPGPILLASSTAALFLLVSAAFIFRRVEKNFADVV